MDSRLRYVCNGIMPPVHIINPPIDVCYGSRPDDFDFQQPHSVAVLDCFPTLSGSRTKKVNPDDDFAAAVLERFPTLVSRRVKQTNPDVDPTPMETLVD
jgi:hypothetical protein